jgi:hypothetical protein
MPGSATRWNGAIYPISARRKDWYAREVKSRPKGIRICSPGISRARRIRGLKMCISELKVLHVEATWILTDLLIKPSAAVVRELCSRFRVLQAYFAIRYREAQVLALAVLGSLQTRQGSPSFLRL